MECASARHRLRLRAQGRAVTSVRYTLLPSLRRDHFAPPLARSFEWRLVRIFVATTGTEKDAGRNASAVLPDPALDVPDAGKGDPIESGEILLIDRPTECPSVLFSLAPVLGPGDRNRTLCHHPVQGDLTR